MATGKRFDWYRFQHRYAPYFFVAPFIIVFAVFLAYPLAKSILLAFFLSVGPKTQVFVGLGNFGHMLGDADFWKAVFNTVFFTLCSVFLQLPLSLGLAVLLNQRFVRLRAFFRFVFFCPYLMGQVFVAFLFMVIFAPRYGLLNRVLGLLSSELLDTQWLQSPGLVMPAMVITALWMYVGFNMIYFLAALQTVDRDLIDAAAVDGANAWQRFVHVTLPSIKPVAVFVVVLSTIGSFQLFELPYLLLQQTSGPDNSGLTIVMYLYERGFVAGDLGFASAVGWVLALVILAISLGQMGLSGSWKKD
jgi:ABC-type sugar transport system permease subunit